MYSECIVLIQGCLGCIVLVFEISFKIKVRLRYELSHKTKNGNINTERQEESDKMLCHPESSPFFFLILIKFGADEDRQLLTRHHRHHKLS